MNIVVTGASRGIGYELVKQFACLSGNKIFAIARNAQKLEQLKNECLSLNNKSSVIPVIGDLSNDTSLEVIIAEIKKQVTSIHRLVNNAGAIVNKPFLELTKADINHIYEVNVFSAIRLIQGLLPLMDEKQKSHITTIASMGGFQGSTKFAGLSAYSSSKSAVACLTECLAEEFKEKNIAFNCLALGAVQTEMLNEAFPGYKAPISAVEIADYIANFVLNAQKIMNGKVIPLSLSTP